MAYGEAKVYYDGSHYIAIPHTTRPGGRKVKLFEELVEVKDDKEHNEKTDKETDSSLLDTGSEPLVLEETEVEEDTPKKK